MSQSSMATGSTSPVLVNNGNNMSVGGPPDGKMHTIPPARSKDHDKGRKPALIPDAYEKKEKAVQRAYDRLKPGHLAYTTPEKMRTGDSATVVARIGGEDVPISALTAGMNQGGEQKVGQAETKVSLVMQMKLTSGDFTINPISSEEQTVLPGTPQTWEWSISPKHGGKLHLHLEVLVELGPERTPYATVDRDIPVEVDKVDAFEKCIERNWKWLISTLALPLVGWLGVRFFGGKPKEDEKKEDEQDGIKAELDDEDST